MILFYLLAIQLLCIVKHVRCQQYDASCGNTYTNVIRSNGTDYYHFINDNSYNVNIDTCFSDIDIKLNVNSQIDNILENSSCPHGNACGNCTNNNYYAENFTIAMNKGIYTIEIKPYYPLQTIGSYQLKISCHSHNKTTNISTSNTTTSIMATRDCDYYSNDIYTTPPSNEVFESIIIRNNTINIQFDIKLNANCNKSLCNILYISSNNIIGTISLSMNGLQNYFEISIMTVFDFNDIQRIPNADQLLPVDGQYHHINLSHTFTVNGTQQNENMFKIDDIIHYYYSYSSLITPNDTYKVYINSPWEDAVNSSITNVCINSFESEQLNIERYAMCKEFNCGDIVSGTFTQNDEKHCFKLNLTNSSSLVYFELCASDIDIYGQLSYINGSIIDQDISCANSKLNSLDAALYILDIHTTECISWGKENYVFHAICAENVVDDEQYKMILANKNQWFFSQLECEKQYGTSLATIITEEDAKEAFKIINATFSSTKKQMLRVWIGLYKDALNGSEWQWIEGTSCKSRLNVDCITDYPWLVTVRNYSYDIVTEIETYLIFAKDVDFSNFSSMIGTQTYDPGRTFDSEFSLCNAPEIDYTPRYCNNLLNCWKNMNVYTDPNLVSDVAFDTSDILATIFHPAIAYWNSTLFIIGLYGIHYTNINAALLNNGSYTFNHKLYHNFTYNWYIVSQRYAQYQSSFYLYLYRYPDRALMHINLDTLNVKYHTVPVELQESYTFELGDPYCTVASQNYVYIIRPSTILIYQTDNNAWNTTKFANVIAGGCAITNDHQYIYVFGNNDGAKQVDLKYDVYSSVFGIIKYMVETAEFHYIPSVNLCNPYTITRAITGRNDKIYLQGCYPASWKTLIFDTKNDQFEAETVDIDVPTRKNMVYYRSSQMTVFDDNVLLLMHTTDSRYPRLYVESTVNSLSLYYSITDSISINFTETILSLQQQQYIWPSDGFDIKYYSNNFKNKTIENHMYFIMFQSFDTINNIYASIALNTSNDDCICKEYNCYHCSQHFYLSNYLSPIDNNVYELQFVLLNNNEFDVLLLPKVLSIKLQRCNLTLNIETAVTNNVDPSIVFKYYISNNCYSRTGQTFSANIIGKTVNISNELIINIIDNKTILCKVCVIKNNNDCYLCNNNTFIIYHETKGLNEGSFLIDIESNMMDLYVISPTNNRIAYAISHDNLNYDLLYLLFLLIIPLICGLSIYIYCKNEYNKSFKINKALVLIIGCSQFDEKKYLLDGVRRNVNDLVNLWKNQYKYHVFVCNEEELYSTRKDIRDFIDEHKVKLEGNNYQCVIIHIISHGLDEGDSFWSSDQKTFKIEDIGRELTDAAKYDIDAPLIKIIFNHACRGENIYTDRKLRGIFSNNNKPSNDNDNDDDNKHDEDINKWEDSNWAIIWGNIKDRAMSDCGDFTECICKSFENNLKKMKLMRSNFRTLITEIGVELENKTDGGEICNINETLRENKIRFEKNKIDKNSIQIQINDDMQHTYIELN